MPFSKRFEPTIKTIIRDAYSMFHIIEWNLKPSASNFLPIASYLEGF